MSKFALHVTHSIRANSAWSTQLAASTSSAAVTAADLWGRQEGLYSTLLSVHSTSFIPILRQSRAIGAG